jgi:hypothetical protein
MRQGGMVPEGETTAGASGFADGAAGMAHEKRTAEQCARCGATMPYHAAPPAPRGAWRARRRAIDVDWRHCIRHGLPRWRDHRPKTGRWSALEGVLWRTGTEEERMGEMLYPPTILESDVGFLGLPSRSACGRPEIRPRPGGSGLAASAENHVGHSLTPTAGAVP